MFESLLLGLALSAGFATFIYTRRWDMTSLLSVVIRDNILYFMVLAGFVVHVLHNLPEPVFRNFTGYLVTAVLWLTQPVYVFLTVFEDFRLTSFPLRSYPHSLYQSASPLHSHVC